MSMGSDVRTPCPISQPRAPMMMLLSGWNAHEYAERYEARARGTIVAGREREVRQHERRQQTTATERGDLEELAARVRHAGIQAPFPPPRTLCPAQPQFGWAPPWLVPASRARAFHHAAAAGKLERALQVDRCGVFRSFISAPSSVNEPSTPSVVNSEMVIVPLRESNARPLKVSDAMAN